MSLPVFHMICELELYERIRTIADGTRDDQHKKHVSYLNASCRFTLSTRICFAITQKCMHM